MVKSIFRIIFIISVISINLFLLSNINYKKELKEDEKQINSIISGTTKLSKKSKYYMILEIPNIKLKRGIYNYDSKYNNVSYGIELLKENGKTIILASHRGTSKVSFFNNLDKLNINDEIIIYKNKKEKYKLNNKYDILKTGKANIIRDENKKSIILITCKKEEKDKQTVYVGYKV